MEFIQKIISRINFVYKKKNENKSEIDRFLSSTEKMTPDEINEYLHNEFMKDLEMFKRLIEEQNKRNEDIKSIPYIKLILEQLKIFYDDLISDEFIKRDFSLFKKDELKYYKIGQSRQEAMESLKELDSNKVPYRKIFTNYNRFYVTNYELLIDEYLLAPAQEIEGKQLFSKGKVMEILIQYKNGRHSELFKNLIPQIRNSIGHRDFIIDPKQLKITFYDREKEPLILSLDKYHEIINNMIHLTLAFDSMDFELRLPILKILIEKIDIVANYLKKNDLKMMPIEGGLSILDLSLLIETGKIK